jgi:hypothetical protein
MRIAAGRRRDAMKGASQLKTHGRRRGLPGLWAVLLALGLAAALAACNGGGDGNNSPTAQPTGEGSPPAQSTPQAATSAACQALTSLDKYRFASNVTLESPEEPVPEGEGQPTPVATLTRTFGAGPFMFNYNVDGSVIPPDKVEVLTNAGGETLPLGIVVIGDRSWATVGDVWQEVGPGYPVPYQPLDVCNAFFPEIDLNQAQGEKETVNGVSALHYTLADVPSGQSWGLIFPESDMAILFQTMDVEVWLAEEDGWPLRMDIQSSGLYSDRRELTGHILVELRDINADDIKVEPPI